MDGGKGAPCKKAARIKRVLPLVEDQPEQTLLGAQRPKSVAVFIGRPVTLSITLPSG